MPKTHTFSQAFFFVALLFTLYGCSTVSGGEAFSAEDEFRAALSTRIEQSDNLSELRASVEAALAGTGPGKQVSLWSLDQALSDNEPSSPSHFALKTAHQVLSDISGDVHYHDDTWIRLRPVLQAMIETINSSSHRESAF